MIKIENSEVLGFNHAIRGMRNPMNSWGRSDSGLCRGGNSGIGCDNCSEEGCQHTYDNSYKIGKNDHGLMTKLVNGGPVHAKFRRMITVYVDITAPLYWWKEFDTYKVGTVANSCSTMHKIHEKEFTLDDFSHEHLLTEGDGGLFLGDWVPLYVLEHIVNVLNRQRYRYLELLNMDEDAFKKAPKAHGLTDNSLSEARKLLWWQMIQLLPSSYNQKRTIMLNYEVLAGIYPMRKNHKLDEWQDFCRWIKSLPSSEIIIGKVNDDE